MDAFRDDYREMGNGACYEYSILSEFVEKWCNYRIPAQCTSYRLLSPLLPSRPVPGLRQGQAGQEDQEALPALFGDVQFGPDEQVVGARGMLFMWVLKENLTKQEDGRMVDKEADEIEGKILDILFADKITKRQHNKNGGRVQVEAMMSKSLLEEANAMLTNNIALMGIGAGLLLVYVAFVLGRANILQQRVTGSPFLWDSTLT